MLNRQSPRTVSGLLSPGRSNSIEVLSISLICYISQGEVRGTGRVPLPWVSLGSPTQIKIDFINDRLHLECSEYTEETAEEVSKMRQ